MHKSIIIAVLAAALAAMPLMAQQPAQDALQDNAPDRYVVVPGDTLWDIAIKFLKDPWRWPEVWKLNQDEIKNPHLIYPGDVIVLDRSGLHPELRLEAGQAGQVGQAGQAGDTSETVKLSPRIRVEDTSKQAIPSIPTRVIEPFLSRPLVIEPDGLEFAPRIIAAQVDRVYLGSGDVAYVNGIKDAKVDSLWQIYQPGKPLIDPESQKTLGYEAVFLGDSRVIRAGEPATIRIFGAQQEIGKGDRLVAAAPLVLRNYVPHAPTTPIQGHVIAARGGLRETGPQYVVTLNKGKNDGLEPGHVLALSRLGGTVVEDVSRKSARDTKNIPWYNMTMSEIFNRGSSEKVTTKLPDERYGLVFVFRTFDQVSYALVMSASRPVLLDDVVSTP
ncbi:MAG: LysM peptidoglycan-binding domain-containing protein [Burkholderiales bacterium]|nr:LysM peptidoglycan-binding domain-containing protein [Burkholderiales bacterium]